MRCVVYTLVKRENKSLRAGPSERVTDLAGSLVTSSDNRLDEQVAGVLTAKDRIAAAIYRITSPRAGR